MDALKSRYKMGKFQHDVGKFTGKDVRMLADGSTLLSQRSYVLVIPTIPLETTRKNQRYSLCTATEISQPIPSYRGSVGLAFKRKST